MSETTMSKRPDDYPRFAKLESWILASPQTLLPALLTACVRACVRKDVFNPGGICRMADKVEKDERANRDGDHDRPFRG